MKRINDSGQTLIALLIFMLVAMTVTIAATAISIINIQSNNGFTSGELALQTAQSGIENALLQLERDPSYNGGTMALGNGTATITISGSSAVVIKSVGTNGNFQRTVTATATDTANVVTLTSWSETP